MIRLGFMSVAHGHATSYLQNLRRLPAVEVIGLADDAVARGRQFALRFDTPWFETYADLLAARPDGVIICAENANHRPLTELAAAAGVHVLSEKPLATSLADARLMIEACQGAGVILMTAFPMRFSAPLQEVETMLAGGGLGRVLACTSTNQGKLPAGSWFVDPKLAGGGAVMDHTVHLVDVLRWYLRREVVEVYAQTNRIIQGDTAVVETGGLLMLTFANGTVASIDCSWSRPKNYPTWGGLTLELIGERGVVNVDAFKQSYDLYGSDGRPLTRVSWGSSANRAMLAEFVAAIREARPPAVTGLDGYKALAVALAAYRSAETGQPVQVNDE